MMMKIVVNQLKQNQTQEKKSIIKKAGKEKHIRKLSPVKMMKTQLIKDCLDLVNLIALSIKNTKENFNTTKDSSLNQVLLKNKIQN